MQLSQLKNAGRRLSALEPGQIDDILCETAIQLRLDKAAILRANQNDLARMSPTDPKYDRLLLNDQRLEALAKSVEQVAALPVVLQIALEERTLPNGLHLRKVSVPLGVVGMIYEARPNVTIDAFALCFKSGNAVALKGGKEAADSNAALVQSVLTVLKRHGLEEAVLLLPGDRACLTTVLQATDYIDVIIPRGSNALIQYVRDNARVPVIETGAGVVHIYYGVEADLQKGKAVIENSKTRRVSVCNALDTLLIEQTRLNDLPVLLSGLVAEKQVKLYADPAAFSALQGQYPPENLFPADADTFGQEFLDYKMGIKTVQHIDEALDHIARYSSRHSECIVTEDAEAARRFLREVDAAVVYVNASTAFTDGGEFGLGAEIGISTQKLHARGPFAMRELTSYKWLVEGDGQVRSA
jgi:glutamate-5-semialdehyde dehydrogenase